MYRQNEKETDNMNIAEAKQHVENAVKAYLAKDDEGYQLLPPEQQRPLFLLGAPGIGKTAIMAQIANELGIGLVAYSMTHHTRQSALGLPSIVHRTYDEGEFDVSEYTMSEIIASVYDYMAVTGRKTGILFLDEVNCVSETLYPSMLQFLQFKTFGRHRVPDGWIVACAGNPPAYNKSVHDFDIVTLDRLRRIDIEPDFDAWKAYSLETGIHPAVLSFLDIRRECFYAVESTPTGKRFVSARGWTDLSRIIGVHERFGMPVERTLIAQYVQDPDIADAFALYYDLFSKYRSDYQIDEILAGRASADIIERAKDAPFDERLALMSLLLDGLSACTSRELDQERLVLAVRDELRAAKEAAAAGEDPAEVLTRAALERAQKLERDAATGTLPADVAKRMQRTAAFLHDAAAACTDTASSSADPLAGATDAYGREVAALEALRDDASAQLDAAFSFVEEAFGADRELLVFATELTARTDCALFIARFGCAAYDRASEGLMVDEQRADLLAQMAELDL